MSGVRFEGYDRHWYMMVPASPIIRAQYGADAQEIFAVEDLETSLFSISCPDLKIARECQRVYATAFDEGERFGRLIASHEIRTSILNLFGLSSVMSRLDALEEHIVGQKDK